MSMYSNGPVSTRRARTLSEGRSGSRSEIQVHTWPFSSGCMVSRKVTLAPSRSSTSTEAYSLNSSGQRSRSLVISQVRSSGAAMTIEFSVCPGMSGPRRHPGVDEVEQGARGLVRLRLAVDRAAVAVLQLGDDAEQAERVEPEVAERRVAHGGQVVRLDRRPGAGLHQDGEVFVGH